MRFDVLLRASVLIFCCTLKLAAQSSTDYVANTQFVLPPGLKATVEYDESDGFLNCKELVDFPRHGSNTSAFQNLSGDPNSAGEAFIIGHGTTAGICTGDGPFCDTTDTSLNVDDGVFWKPPARRLVGKFSRLTIFGCSVGRYQEGADFVAAMAEATQMTVRAPTGTVWCAQSHLSLGSDVDWIEAKPGEKPERKDGPIYTVQEGAQYKLSKNGKLTEVQPQAVHVTKFHFSGLPPRPSADASASTAQELGKLIDFANPIELQGVPLAAVTGRIELWFSLQGDARVQKVYLLYADSMVQDQERKDLFYRVDSRVRPALQQLRLQLR
jgi:hypothetical protein